MNLDHLKKSIEEGIVEFERLEALKQDLIRQIDEDKWRRVKQRLDTEIEKWRTK